MKTRTIHRFDLSESFLSETAKKLARDLNDRASRWDLRRRKHEQAIEVSRNGVILDMKLDNLERLAEESVGVLQEELEIRLEWSTVFELRRQCAVAAVNPQSSRLQETRERIEAGLLAFGYLPRSSEPIRGRIQLGMIEDHPAVITEQQHLQYLEQTSQNRDLLRVNGEGIAAVERELQNIRSRRLVNV